MLLDRSEMSAEIGDEVPLSPNSPEIARCASIPARSEGSAMGLRVVDHLQPVLEAAQETIVVNQLRRRSRDRSGRLPRAARSASQVGPTRSSCSRPPQISCCVWAKNSISRIPPRPVLMSCPSTAIRPPPRCALIWRLIEWMSWMAAKSRFFRQMNGCSSRRKSSSGGAVAGDRTGLDQRSAFPILPDALVIGERRRNRHRERRRCGIRAKPKIGAERHSRHRCKSSRIRTSSRVRRTKNDWTAVARTRPAPTPGHKG